LKLDRFPEATDYLKKWNDAGFLERNEFNQKIKYYQLPSFWKKKDRGPGILRHEGVL